MDLGQMKGRLALDRSFLWFGIGLLALMLGLLVGPRVPYDQQAEHCIVNVYLPGPFGIGLNCDSTEFMRLAREPGGLLEPFNTRQSRPGQIFVAAALTWILSPLRSLADRMVQKASRPDIDPQRIANSLAKDFPGYVAYILLNIVILLAAFYFFRKLCLPWQDGSTPTQLAVAAMGLLLVSNDVVKAFVWSPHNQMFNIFVPVFTLYAAVRTNAGALLQRRFAILFGIGTGLGALAYPFFVTVLPCVAGCAIVYASRHNSRDIWLPLTVNFIVLVVLTALPEALWAAFVILKTGGFYQHEVERYHQVVWILEAWQTGFAAVAQIWSAKLDDFLRRAVAQAVPLIAVSILAGALLLANRKAAMETRPSPWPLLATAVLVAAISTFFYVTVGQIVWRLAYSAIPALIVAAAAVGLAATNGNVTGRKVLAGGSVIIVLAAALYTVVKNGPWA
jgi:hypothetical protein